MIVTVALLVLPTLTYISAHTSHATTSPSSTRQQTSSSSALPHSCEEAEPCSSVSAACLDCRLDNVTCEYGQLLPHTCTARGDCSGDRAVQRELPCKFCYQFDLDDLVCTPSTSCRSKPDVSTAWYTANCTLLDEKKLCLGRRNFQRRLRCNWTSGYRWTTALVLSVTLGGVGADRFYLGQWREGIAKLFSFGGLGVWTLVDVVLIAIGYVGPDDGSLLIY